MAVPRLTLDGITVGRDSGGDIFRMLSTTVCNMGLFVTKHRHNKNLTIEMVRIDLIEKVTFEQ